VAATRVHFDRQHGRRCTGVPEEGILPGIESIQKPGLSEPIPKGLVFCSGQNAQKDPIFPLFP